jgi:glycosyltransferase involved in cell wall biosynthesis
MRVGIDATYLLEPRKSGVETYTLNLVRALLPLPGRPETYLYAAGPEAPPDAAALFEAADRRWVSRVSRLWLRLRLPLALWLDAADVAHFPGTLLPAWLPCPAVTTFYDLARFHYPDLYDPSEQPIYEHAIPRSAERSAIVIAISEATKQDLMRFLSVPEPKIAVTPLGVDARFHPQTDARQTVAERFGLEAPYILACVGSGHARKNLKAAVEAFDLLSAPGPRLVVVGAADRDAEALAAIERSPRREGIVLLGHIPEADLPAVYSAAEVFCFPSLHEGFGLPVLEAMACGTPVVCSNTSSLPEVAGEAAVMVDPRDVGALAVAIDGLLQDPDARAVLREAGLARAREFTWERTARLTVAAYQQAAGRRAGRDTA